MSDLIVNKEILKNELKNIAKKLGSEWVYTYHTTDLSPLDDSDDYSAWQTVTLHQDGHDVFTLSCHNSDPDALWITSTIAFPLSIVFGPVDEIHIQDEEPKIIFESFQGERVNFIEISSDGKIYEYHYQLKSTYRLGMQHSY